MTPAHVLERLRVVLEDAASEAVPPLRSGCLYELKFTFSRDRDGTFRLFRRELAIAGVTLHAADIERVYVGGVPYIGERVSAVQAAGPGGRMIEKLHPAIESLLREGRGLSRDELETVIRALGRVRAFYNALLVLAESTRTDGLALPSAEEIERARVLVEEAKGVSAAAEACRLLGLH